LVELKEKRLRKSLSEAKNEWQGQKDLNPRHVVLELKHMFVKRCCLVTLNIKQPFRQTNTCLIRQQNRTPKL